MRDYPIKRGHFKNIEGELFTNLLKEYFDNYSEEGGVYIASFGSLSRISLQLQGKTRLTVETETRKGSDEAEMMKTHRVYSDFLLKATGFTSKERMKRMKKSGGKDK